MTSASTPPEPAATAPPASPQETASEMTALLREAFAPDHLEVIDESHLHRGHAGAASGKGHFRLVIASAAFQGRSLVDSHRMIYDKLRDIMNRSVHALSIEVPRKGKNP